MMLFEDHFNPMDASLSALSPLDGRYHWVGETLGAFFSESALIRYRIEVEVQWLLFLLEQKSIRAQLTTKPNAEQMKTWISLVKQDHAASRVKEIEKTTNHDVKAVEYFLRESMQKVGLPDSVQALIHFGCTSEDINNCSYALMVRNARDQVLIPRMEKILAQLAVMAQAQSHIPMLSRTHGQTASPTTMGKEIAVFHRRLANSLEAIKSQVLEAKMNGAVGNYHAHLAAYPDVDWPELARTFLETKLQLAQNPLTTQIENHDTLVALCDAFGRWNTIAIDLARDFWGYISLGYFRQMARPGEVGSSTMPHKVNPIDFENAEGNLGLARAMLAHFSEKLPISRWQRDLSDSTVMRSLGVAFGYSLLAYHSLAMGLDRIALDEKALAQDLDQTWEVLTEAAQAILRRNGCVDAYERLKDLSRGRKITAEDWNTFIQNTKEFTAEDKKTLTKLRPSDYVGCAQKLVEKHL